METAVYSNSTQHTRHISSHMPASPQQSQMTSGWELDEKSPNTGRLHRRHIGGEKAVEGAGTDCVGGQ